MKYLSFVLLAPLFTMQVFAQSSGSLPSAIPPSKAKAQFSETEFDFGYMPSNASVSHSYWVHSRGEDSLKILRVKPSCGCTKAPLKKEVIAPNDSGPIELVFKSEAAQRGNVKKYATVTCNDNLHGNVKVYFSAKIYNSEAPDSLTPLSLSTSSLSWNAENKNDEQSLKLTNISSQPTKVTLVSRPFGFAEISFDSKILAPGESEDISVRIAPGLGGNDFQKSFTLACSDPAKTRYTIPLTLTGMVKTQPAPVGKKRPVSKTNTSQSSGGSH